MKQILIIAMILSISLVSAFYPGETIVESHNLGTDKTNWLIVDNTSEITILPEITFNSTDIIIYFPQNMPPNNFILIFVEEKTNEVIKEVQVGGGGTRTIYKNNTITKKEYVDVPRDVEKEVIKEVPVETIKEIKKPFYKSIWFYLAIGLIIFIGTMYYFNRRGVE